MAIPPIYFDVHQLVSRFVRLARFSVEVLAALLAHYGAQPRAEENETPERRIGF